MELLFSKIQDKLDKFALYWAPDDVSLISILYPWKKFFSESYWDGFFSKFIIPKLNYIVSKTEINPKDQKIESIKILFIWSELIPLKQISEILIQNFFPKFIETFKLWLSQNPKIEELLKWYEGWKKVFSNKNLLESSTEIQNVFKIILTLLNNYVVKNK
jgi:tuftelin-interacting protein 11